MVYRQHANSTALIMKVENTLFAIMGFGVGQINMERAKTGVCALAAHLKRGRYGCIMAVKLDRIAINIGCTYKTAKKFFLV